MNAILDYWAICNTVVIMLALGMLSPRPAAMPATAVLRAALLYNVAIPALALTLLHASDALTEGAMIAVSLCVAASGGTSAGAFVGVVHGIPTLAARLIILLMMTSLVVITVFLQLDWIPRGDFSLLSLAAILMALTLIPLGVGKALRRRLPSLTRRWQPVTERLGSALVILLVIALAVRYGAEILGGPGEPLLAGLALTLLFMLPPLIMEPDPSWRRTVTLVTLIRNLSLVLSLLAVFPPSFGSLATVLAFGLCMYMAAGLLVWRWRYSPLSPAPLETQP